MAFPVEPRANRSEASCNARCRVSRLSGQNSKYGAFWAVTLLFLSFWAVGISAQGLILVPPIVTRELGSYYLSKLGLGENGLDHYAILSQRNIRGNNIYAWVNDIANTESPVDAAARISGVRGMYSQNAIGGKVTVEIFYKILRCEDADCFGLSRVIATELAGPSAPLELLTYVKTTMGATRWLVNAPQWHVNPILGKSSERPYQDEVYRTRLFYKVAAQQPPCSSAEPQTLVGSLSEFERLPDFGCINYDGLILMVGTTTPDMLKRMQVDALPWEQCDGSLSLLYDPDGGPRITRVIRNPGEVPFTVRLALPVSNTACFTLYSNPDLAVKAAQVISGHRFAMTVDAIEQLPEILALGFNASCEPTYFVASYGYTAIGQSEAISDSVNIDTEKLIPYNATGACISMLGVNQPDPNTRVASEDSCAQLFFGNAAQQNEGIITLYGLDPDVGVPAAADRANLEVQCADYQFGISTILPQIAVDFEAEKRFLLSSTEVKLHLDGVAANAASVLAVEVALAGSGIVVARTIARSGLYRRRRVSSSVARTIALVTTAVGITVFNIPNFALISRSLHNHGKTSVYTQASVHEYRPTNFSAVLKAETHSFVTVQGSSATAVIGLLLYTATLFFCLYITWTEFTEIIHRRNEAASRLGHEALIADKDLLIQWRGTDSLLHDTLHPKAVVESGLVAEIELMRRNLAKNRVQTPRGANDSPRGTPLAKADSSREPPADLYNTPDLYPGV